MSKGLYYQNSFLGVLGEKTGRFADYYIGNYRESVELCVGDVVSFYEYGRIYTKVVTRNSLKNEYGVFGFGSNRLDFQGIIRILTYRDLTEDIFQKLQESTSTKNRHYFTIRDIDVKEMTIEQIEKLLGYQVRIINSK